jgi:hypothetical protein
MLVQLVRPLVRTQVQMLSQSPSASSKLIGMVSQWLGYLGIQAEVTQLNTMGDRIQVLLFVGKPEQCTATEWQKILENLSQESSPSADSPILTYSAMTPPQQSKVHRLLAAVLQAGSPNALEEWPDRYPQLLALGMEAAMLQGIQAALKAPKPLELLIEQLDPEVAAFVLAKAIHIALMDRQISPAEDSALKALLNALDRDVVA